MKLHLPLRLACALLCCYATTTVRAAQIIKNDAATSLNQPEAWTGGTVPGTSDIAEWNASSAPGTSDAPLSLGGDTSWAGLKVNETAGELHLYIGETDPADFHQLSLGASGLAVSSSATLSHQITIGANLHLSSAQTWTGAGSWQGKTSQISILGDLRGTGNLGLGYEAHLNVAVQGDASGYTGNITMNVGNAIIFSQGLTGGNIAANHNYGKSSILVENGNGTTYAGDLTLFHDASKASDGAGANSFTLSSGTLTLAGTTSIGNDLLNIGSGASLNVTGALTLNNAQATLADGATMTVSHTGTVGNGTTFTLGHGSTLRFIATGDAKTTFSNTTTFKEGGTVEIVGTHTLTAGNGKITIGAGTTLDLTQGRLVYSGYHNAAESFIINGTLKITNFSYDGSIGLLADYGHNRSLDGGSVLISGTSHASGQGFTVNNKGNSFLMTQSGQTLTLNGNANSATITFGNASNDVELTLGGDGNIIINGNAAQSALSGHGSLVKTGAGTLTLNHQSSGFSGTVTLTEGTLDIAHNQAIGTGDTSLVYAGGVLDLGNNALANITISFKNGKTEGDIRNASSFLGRVNIGDSGQYELSGAPTFGSGYAMDADTTFTLAADVTVGHIADGLGNYIDGQTYALTLSGEGRHLVIDRYDGVNGVLYAQAVTFENMGDITFTNNTSASSGYDRSGAVTANGAITFQNTGNVTMNANRAGEGLNGSDAAITGFGGALMANEGISFDSTGDLEFKGNSAAQSGGALYDAMGETSMTNVGNITFADNTAGGSNAIDNGYGGAIFEGSGSVTVDGARDVAFTGNAATTGGGGAVYALTDLVISNVNRLTVTGNTASESGGAFRTDSGSVSISNAAETTFSDNSAGIRGGAIDAGDSVSLTDMTGPLTFSNNAARNLEESADSGNGGAIYAYNDVTIARIGGDVHFTDNSAAMYGGALSAVNVTLSADGGNIVFNGNTQSGGTMLNAIDSRYGGEWNFSAAAGREIAFFDPVTGSDETAVTVNLNTEADSTGSIRFSGEHVAEHAAGKTGLDAAASRYSDIYADTTFAGGRLVLENGVTYGHVSSDWSSETVSTSFTGTGGTIAIDKTSTLSAQVIALSRTTLDASKGGNLSGEQASFEAGKILVGDTLTVNAPQGLTFGSGVVLEATSAHAALSGTFTMTDGIAFTISQEGFQTLALTGASLTVTGVLVIDDRQIDYTIDYWSSEREFILLSADAASSITGDFTGIVTSSTGSSVVFETTPTLPTGQWQYHFSPDNTQLIASWTPGVPEPASVSLALLGLGLTLLRRRREL